MENTETVVYSLFEPGDTCRLVHGCRKGGEEKKNAWIMMTIQLAYTQEDTLALYSFWKPVLLKNQPLVWFVAPATAFPGSRHKKWRREDQSALRFNCASAARIFFFCLHHEALKPSAVTTGVEMWKWAFWHWALRPAALCPHTVKLRDKRTIQKAL